MDDPARQLGLFGAKVEIQPIERELSQLGVTRREVAGWHNDGVISFDPHRVQKLERWMFDEVVFIRDLRKVEWSLNALRQLLATLKRPYTLNHGQHFFNFRLMKWERRYLFYEMPTAILEQPEVAAEAACGLIRGVADFGTREQLLKILAELERVLKAGGSGPHLNSDVNS